MVKPALAASAFATGMLLAGAAMAQAQNPDAYQAMSGGPAWHPGGAAVGEMYTHALNALYAQGFHAVRHITIRDGAVQAMAVTPAGQARRVTVLPHTDKIAAG